MSFSLHLSAATQNVTEVYEIGVLASVPVLIMEKAETWLLSVLCDIRQLATTRERVDLTLGIVCTVGYFHDHLKVADGLISSATVFARIFS